MKEGTCNGSLFLLSEEKSFEESLKIPLTKQEIYDTLLMLLSEEENLRKFNDIRNSANKKDTNKAY